MSIKKRVQNSLLGISLAAIIILMILSLVGIFMIRQNLSTQMNATNENITSDNTQDMLSMSMQLAESTARLNGRKINGDFARIKGELLTVKGDIENLYAGGGIRNVTSEITRCEEYIVSQRAQLSQQDIDQTVSIMSGVTAMFDNVLANEDKISLAYIVLENGMVFSSTDTFYSAVEKMLPST